MSSHFEKSHTLPVDFDNKTTPGIYKYNIETNESQMIYKYNNTFNPAYHGQFIDPSNNTVILFGGNYNTFQVFDLNINQMIQKHHPNILSTLGGFPQIAFIPSPINNIHILNTQYKFNHYKF
eukprot:446389_1